MVSAEWGANTGDLVIRPRLGTGWETTVDGLRQEVRLRFRLLDLLLPVSRKVPFSQVSNVGVVARESWWSRAGTGCEDFETRALYVGSVYVSKKGAPMPGKGWRYDLYLTQKGSRTTRLEVFKAYDAAYQTADQMRQRIGLAPVA